MLWSSAESQQALMPVWEHGLAVQPRQTLQGQRLTLAPRTLRRHLQALQQRLWRARIWQARSQAAPGKAKCRVVRCTKTSQGLSAHQRLALTCPTPGRAHGTQTRQQQALQGRMSQTSL